MKIRTVCTILPLVLLLSGGCDDIASNIPYPEAEIINKHIRELSLLDQMGEFEERKGPITDKGPCVYSYTLQTGNDENINLDPDCSWIYPGALFDGSSILDGEYGVIDVNRRRLTVTLSSIFKINFGSIDINPVYPETRNSLACVARPPIPEVNHKIENVYNADHLKILLPVHLKTDPPIDTIFNFDPASVTRKKLIQYKYIYYTASCDAPKNPSDFFDPSVTWEELRQWITEPVSPVYISRVKYGKMGFIFIESDADDNDLTAALNHALDDVPATTENALFYRKILDNSTIKSLTIGQESKQAITTLSGFDDLSTHASRLKDYTKINECYPIIYSLNYLKLRELNTLGVVLSAQYYLTECGNDDRAYKLTVSTVRDDGIPYEMVADVTYVNEIPLDAVEEYTSEGTVYRFSYWEPSQTGVIIDDITMNHTTAHYFENHCTIIAHYEETGSIDPTPSPPAETVTNPPTYTLTYDTYNAAGVKSSPSRSNLQYGSTVSISTAGSYSHSEGTMIFDSWRVASGSARIIQAGSASNASVTEFKANTRVVPGYSLEPSDPPPPPTPEYTLTVRYRASDGTAKTENHTMTAVDSVTIGTTDRYRATDGTTMRFQTWGIASGSAAIENAGSADGAVIKNLSKDTTVEASYIAVLHTLQVTYNDSSGTSYSVTYKNLKETDTISISTASQINSGTTLYFKQWHLSGEADIGSPISAGTSVTNFRGNASVSPEYGR
ncbi:MAG: thiol-activated cytolysin family protein [Spirochaetales bacterium]|nr:thiol-activated cytolysin family protein [Spirochaetales bacterium]